MPCNALSIKWCHTSARCENVRRADISSICSSCTPALQGISIPTLTCRSSKWLHLTSLQKYELLIGLLYNLYVYDDLSKSREISERLTLNTDDLSEDFELHHKRYYARQDPSPHQKITTTDTLPHKIQHPQWAKPRNSALVHSTCVSVKNLDWHIWISTAHCTLGHLEFQSPHRWMICWIRRSWD